MKVWYMGLESIEARYTMQLEDWNIRAFKKARTRLVPVRGLELQATRGRIVNGSVLDAHGRTYYAVTQHAQLIAHLQAGDILSQDVIFYEDMFTPGIESLPYIFNQTPAKYRPRVFVRCLAQTIDPDDFVNRTGMFDFMRKYEEMVGAFVDGILVASEEMVAHLRIAGFKCPIYVTGLPFGKQEVRARIQHGSHGFPSFVNRARVVSYAARLDSEKQPHFLMQVIKELKHRDPGMSFKILSGGDLRSDDPTVVPALRAMARKGQVTLYENLTKNEYYRHLAWGRVLFNCALQDWVSNTVSEADTFGCMTVFPAYRSFPEVFANNAQHMYIPWSVDDAVTKVLQGLDGPTNTMIGKISDYQDKTIARTIEVFKGKREPAGDDYRKDVAKAKY